jgi:hypothetical protein
MLFQPRIGIVSRSLAHALHDIGNFLLMLSIVLLFYAAAGNTLFGSYVSNYATFSDSIRTCLSMLMGDTSVGAELRALTQPLRTVGVFFFWSFMVLVFLLLFNFALAIICDAFCEVKEATDIAQGLWEEIWSLLRDFFLRFSGTRRLQTHEIGALLQRWANGAEAANALVTSDTDMREETAAVTPFSIYCALKFREVVVHGEWGVQDGALPGSEKEGSDKQLRYMASWIWHTLRPQRICADSNATSSDPDALVRCSMLETAVPGFLCLERKAADPSCGCDNKNMHDGARATYLLSTLAQSLQWYIYSNSEECDCRAGKFHSNLYQTFSSGHLVCSSCRPNRR